VDEATAAMLILFGIGAAAGVLAVVVVSALT